MNTLFNAGVIVGVVVIALIALGLILARLYRRSSKEVSFVRTGFGGQRVILNGGALVLPVLHEVIPVNMNTLRLEVRRVNEQALITRDRMRVDVGAEFYVRVAPDGESISAAAQTLGRKTMQPDELKELVEGKFVDALRSVAAGMTMTELHEQRADFIQRVQQVVTEDLRKNGLELETVSLTGLDQTSIDYFNPQNAFDAEGMTRLTEEIQGREKSRNDVEQDTKVAIRQKNLESEQRVLEIEREEEYARLEQQREIEVRRAAQAAEIAREQAERKRESEQAEIQAEQQTERSRIDSELDVERARIDKDRQTQEADIERRRQLEAAEIEREKSRKLAEQGQEIAIAEKSREQSEAQAEADRARAVAVTEEEQVETVRETARADRDKAVKLVAAREDAERQAIGVTVAAEAEKQAAADRAEANRIEAEGQATHERLVAEGERDARIARADAEARAYEVEADGQRRLNEAANTLEENQIAMQVRMELLRQLPEIIRESVRPMERIEGIKILNVDGINPSAGNGGNGDGGDAAAGNGNLAEQAVNAALRYRGQAPLVDNLLAEVGLKGDDLQGLASGLADSGVVNGDAKRPRAAE